MGKKILQLITAVSIFISLIISTTWIIGNKLHVEEKLTAIKKASPLPPKETPLFYRTIGDSASMSKNLIGSGRSPQKKNSTQNRYTVEILVTTNQSRAETVVNDLKSQKVRAFYSAFNKQGRVFYKVRTGLFNSKTAADKHLKTIISEKYKGMKIRKL